MPTIRIDCQTRSLPLQTEGMFLSVLFAHHKALKELQNKIDQINKLLQEPN